MHYLSIFTIYLLNFIPSTYIVNSLYLNCSQLLYTYYTIYPFLLPISHFLLSLLFFLNCHHLNSLSFPSQLLSNFYTLIFIMIHFYILINYLFLLSVISIFNLEHYYSLSILFLFNYPISLYSYSIFIPVTKFLFFISFYS